MLRNISNELNNPAPQSSFVNDKQETEIDKQITKIKTSSPCEAAMLTMMRSVEKGWVPEYPKNCSSTIQLFLALSQKAGKPDKIKNNFSEHYPDLIRCLNGNVSVAAIEQFGQPEIEEHADDAASVIQRHSEIMEKISKEQTPMTSFFYRHESEQGHKMAANLRLFSDLHFKCRTSGSKKSMRDAQVHIDEIKKRV